MRIFSFDSRTLTLKQGDITREPADALVNAANSHLVTGAGVAGAIHRAGGPQLDADCARVRARIGALDTGRAVATIAGNLPARHVIHTVGPVWHGGARREPELLASCYRESLRLADELAWASIVFPAISTGVFGYPLDLAADTALRTVRDVLPTLTSVRDVRFILFDSAAYNHFLTTAERILQGSS